MELWEILALFGKAFLIGNIVMVVFALMTWVERRLLSFFQYRLGPNRVGPFGLLQPIADLLKLIHKENFRPNAVSSIMHLAAPAATLFFALAVFAVIPFGDQDWNLFGWETPPWMAADLDVAVLFAIAMSGLGGYGVIVGGWASNSKYALLGALRACAQLISYEITLTLAMLPVILMTGSLSMSEIAGGHVGWDIGGVHVWFIVWAPLGFVLFLIAALAEANRAPFDHAEAEQELVGGFHTEYGGLRYAAFANAEYLHLLAISAIGVTFFLGGTSIPFVEDGGPWLDLLSFAVKMAFFVFAFIWIRATVPRLRYDRLMRMGWKALLPIATVQFLLTALLVSQGWGRSGDEQARTVQTASPAISAPADPAEVD
ncbi:MAG: nuoH-2 [Thermoleophilia bacterium]|nr:nuoH-2 [Thermoleophilia bacterium]